MSWEITKETKIEPRLNNPLLIEGLPGIGNVGKIAVDFFVEELKAKKLCSFFSYKFPHSVFVNNENLIDMPKIELYYKQFHDAKKRDLLLLIGDIQPLDEESCYAFCAEVLNLAQHYGCKEIITTGGIGLQNLPEKPKLYCTANDAALLKEYQQKSMLLEEDIFGVVGPIIGVSGVLLGLGQKRGLKGVAILAETFGHPMYLGIKGAKEIIRCIENKLKFGLDMIKMDKQIFALEKEMLARTKEWAAELLASSVAGAKLKKKETSYIG